MDAKTLTALKASIKHWEENATAETQIEASACADDCALCQAFELCRGCPVAAATGQDQCDGTPFYGAREALWHWEDGTGTRENWQLAAQRELDFLKSLLPEGERP